MARGVGLSRGRGGGGTLGIFGWGCTAGTLEPLAYTRPIDQFRYIKIHTWLRGLGE